MHRYAKSIKRTRDEGAIRGIRKHLSGERSIILDQTPYTPEELEAFFRDHLAALDRIDALTRERSAAVAVERAAEARLAPIYVHLKKMAESMLGAYSARMRDFDIEPAKVPTMTAETKKRANAKRQATRKKRGIGGKK
jgi:hypothetical protein